MKYGHDLVEALGHCNECHAPVVNGVPDIEHQGGAGGQPIPAPWGIAVTTNITPHEDGIRDYTDSDIKRAITKGEHPDGSKLSRPMAFACYRNILPGDVDAIVACLRTLESRPTP